MWQVEAPLLTGFLDSEATPLVQAYELKVRLEHILSRCTALTDTIPSAAGEDGLPSTAPVGVAPGLFIGGVLVAGSRKDLKAAGITHVVNAAGSQVTRA
jgi:atypical dual specificity phosphatase